MVTPNQDAYRERVKSVKPLTIARELDAWKKQHHNGLSNTAKLYSVCSVSKAAKAHSQSIVVIRTYIVLVKETQKPSPS